MMCFLDLQSIARSSTPDLYKQNLLHDVDLESLQSLNNGSSTGRHGGKTHSQFA